MPVRWGLEDGQDMWKSAQRDLASTLEAGTSSLHHATTTLLESSPGGQQMKEMAAFAGLSMRSCTSVHNGVVSRAPLPGVGFKAKIDDFDASIIFVLPIIPPRMPASGEVDCRDDEQEGSNSVLLPDVGDPRSAARRVFLHGSLSEDLENLDMALGEAYQQFLRTHLEEVIVQKCGLRLSSFESIDGDVVFWKIAADAARLEELAERFHYIMPFSTKAYEEVGISVPIVHNVEMRAHSKFTRRHAADFQEFRSMDAIRLVTLELLQHLNLNELRSQGVIARWFPAVKYDEIMTLTEALVAWPYKSRLGIPGARDVDHFRTYFGEEVAVFFGVFGTYLRWLPCIAASAAAVVFIAFFRPFGADLVAVNTAHAIYGGIVIFWGILFCYHLEHLVARDKLRWCSDGNTSAEVQVEGYRPEHRGSWKQSLFSWGGKVVTALFLAFVVITCGSLSLYVPPKAASAVQTGVTMVFSTIWGKIAKRIVEFENKRTQARFNQSLTMRLAFVKLFIFLFPLVRLAFIAPVAQHRCGPVDELRPLYHDFSQNNLQELNISANSVMFADWMEIRRIKESNFVDYTILFLAGIHLSDSASGPSGAGCFRGCYPKQCERVATDYGERLRCKDTCFLMLEHSLNMLYITHILCTIVNVVLPMVQLRWAAQAEVKKAQHDEDGEVVTDYTLLQFQEKCHALASYEYQSRGGSYVEDFLEVVLGFGVLVCFSIVSPWMAIIGFFSQLIEYRLLAFRMLWVTCRPFPAGSEGISEWLNVLNVIIYISIGMASLLLVAVLRTGLDSWMPMKKLLFVLGVMLSFIVLKVVMRVVCHEQTTEVIDATDVNHEFKEALRLKRAQGASKQEEVHGPFVSRVQLGVGGR